MLQNNIPFEIYERDVTADARGQGWAITLHWALSYMEKILPDDAIARVQNVQVDPDVAHHDNGNFLFINLANGHPKFKIPPNRRWRVNREKMRQALIVGLEQRIHWGKRVIGIKPNIEEQKVRIILQDGYEVEGSLVVGIEGSRSVVRQMLRPDAYANHQLPVRFTGVALNMSPTEISALRAMDPLLFQGCHPSSGTFFWFSVLETPELNGSSGTDHEYYRAQICMSWLFRNPDDEVGATDKERLANMKKRAQGFALFLKRTVELIPDGTLVMEIKLADWECLSWDNISGLITLAGDAAHAMTMCKPVCHSSACRLV